MENIVEIARKFAFTAHESINQLYDGQPYKVHLIMAECVCSHFGYLIPNEEDYLNVSAGVYCHDVIEDVSSVTYNDLKKATNEMIAELAYACTNEKGRNRKERANDKYYEGIRNTKYATFVKLCDRIANVQASVEKNSRMLDLYKKEQEHFKKMLYVAGEYEDMWNFIDDLLK